MMLIFLMRMPKVKCCATRENPEKNQTQITDSDRLLLLTHPFCKVKFVEISICVILFFKKKKKIYIPCGCFWMYVMYIYICIMFFMYSAIYLFLWYINQRQHFFFYILIDVISLFMYLHTSSSFTKCDYKSIKSSTKTSNRTVERNFDINT